MKKIKSSLILLTFAATAICGLGFAAKTTSKESVPTFATYTNHDADTYYSGISDSLTGDSLLSALQSLNSSKRKTTVGYNSMGTTPSGQFKYTDYDPDSVKYDSNGQPYGTKLTTFYSGNSATSGMNREHVWPKSHGGNNVDSDIHMPRPTLQAENGSRGNSFYVEGKCHSSNGWDPAMESFGVESYRGDSARIILYCVVADSKLSLLEADSHATSNSNRDNLMGRLSDLIKWHLKYPVLEREQNRNEGAEYLQGNRNPFIDHRSYACKIWGNSNSTTKSYCDQYNGWTDGDEPTPTKTLTDLTYSGTPTKKNYLVGESFDSTGLTVSAKFSDNTSQTVTNDVTWSTLVEGQTSVTGSYTYQGTTKKVVVSGITVSKPAEKTLSSLSKTGTLAKKDYLVGESFDPSGLTITANFSDGSSQTVTNSVVWPTLVEGQTSIKGSYTYKGITEEITVSGITVTKPIEKTLSSLSMTGTLAKKDYVVGESFNPTGLTITANFSDGSSEIVTNQVVWPKLTVNQTSITGSYTYKGATKTIVVSGITVTEPVKPKTLVGLDFDGELVKKDYVVGESFDPTGLTITASFTDYSTEDVTDEVVWATLQEGKTSVTGSYTYEGVTRIVSINCITVTKPAKHLVSLSCEGAPNKKDYIEGETFNPYGLVIKANFDDGSFENVTNEVQWPDLFVGMTSVTGRYTYDGVTKDITITGITVYPDVVEKNLESLSFVGEPTKKIYCIGESFDSTGLTITATFSDGSSEIVNEQVVWDTLKVGDTSVKGSYTYKDVTKTISVPNITVYDEPVAVTGVTLTPSTSTLKVGSTTMLNCVIEPANATNKNVTWSSSDNSIATVSDNGLITALKEGNVTITVTTEDGNISASSNITVYNEELNREMVGIVAINLPNKVVYNVNETFSKEGLKVISIYNDGTHEDVTDLALVANPNLSSVGTKSIEISYNNFRTSFDIVVLKTTVKSLQLQRVPAKTEYFSNEPFNPFGCVIKALLSDNSELANVIDQCSFEYDFTKSNLVAASFGGQRIIFSITIIQGTPTVEHKAADFAYSFNEQMDEVNPENVTEEEWNSLEYYYNQLDEESKEYVKNLNNDSGNAVHAGACDEEALNQCVSKYDETYLAHKNDGFEDFIGRNPKAHNNNDNKDKDNSSLAIILGVIGGIVVLTIIIISIAVPVSKKNKKKYA